MGELPNNTYLLNQRTHGGVKVVCGVPERCVGAGIDGDLLFYCPNLILQPAARVVVVSLHELPQTGEVGRLGVGVPKHGRHQICDAALLSQLAVRICCRSLPTHGCRWTGR